MTAAISVRTYADLIHHSGTSDDPVSPGRIPVTLVWEPENPFATEVVFGDGETSNVWTVAIDALHPAFKDEDKEGADFKVYWHTGEADISVHIDTPTGVADMLSSARDWRRFVNAVYRSAPFKRREDDLASAVETLLASIA